MSVNFDKNTPNCASSTSSRRRCCSLQDWKATCLDQLPLAGWSRWIGRRRLLGTGRGSRGAAAGQGRGEGWVRRPPMGGASTVAVAWQPARGGGGAAAVARRRAMGGAGRTRRPARGGKGRARRPARGGGRQGSRGAAANHGRVGHDGRPWVGKGGGGAGGADPADAAVRVRARSSARRAEEDLPSSSVGHEPRV